MEAMTIGVASEQNGFGREGAGRESEGKESQ